MNNKKIGQYIKIKEKNKKNKIIMLLIIMICLVMILIINLSFFKNSKSHKKQNELKNNYDCTLTKTYNVTNINTSNDENYLYITFKEYQLEDVYTIKLPQKISKDLKLGNNYEFTFNTYKKYVSETPNIIFENSKLINIQYTDKVGMEQNNTFNCK